MDLIQNRFATEDYVDESVNQLTSDYIAEAVDAYFVEHPASGLTTEQISALNNMFKVCAFIKADVSAEYNTFKTAFGITGSGDSGGSGGGDEPGGLVDTTAKIAAYDKGYYWGSQIEAADYTGACVTEAYPYTNDIDKLKAHSDYDAENDCMTGTTMFPQIVYYIPNAKFTEAGNSVQSTRTKFAYSRDGVFYTVGSVTVNVEKTTSIGGKTNNDMYGNGVAFTLFTADVDDSYAYWSVTGSQIAPVGVQHGDVIFAGKNTPYYGMANIDGTMAVKV